MNIEFQNIKHVKIKRPKNVADMNRYFSENRKLWRGFSLYLGKDSTLCFVNS